MVAFDVSVDTRRLHTQDLPDIKPQIRTPVMKTTHVAGAKRSRSANALFTLEGLAQSRA
jgi:hypothetical protein